MALHQPLGTGLASAVEVIAQRAGRAAAPPRARGDASGSASVEATVHFGIPVTAPARTLLDLADVLDDAALARAVNEARLKRFVTWLRTAPGPHARTAAIARECGDGGKWPRAYTPAWRRTSQPVRTR